MIDNLRHLDETSDKLLKRGHIREAIDCIDLALERRKELLGPGSHAFNLSCLNSAATFMNIAMDQTHNMNTKSRVSLLSRAEELSQSSDSSKITVWYNIAILYQSENKLKLAYKYLKMALASQSRLNKIGDRRISIDMHLIMSSVLSQLKKHKMALRHARIALTLVKGCITEEQKQQISSTENVDGREESMDWMISFDNLSRNWHRVMLTNAEQKQLRFFVMTMV